MYDFAAGPGGFVAAGQTLAADPRRNQFGPLGVWSSSDGRTWNPLGTITSVGQVEVLSVAGDGAHVVVAYVDKAGDLGLVVATGRPALAIDLERPLGTSMGTRPPSTTTG